MTDRTALRRQDFWTALGLIAASLFFLWRTEEIPFFRADAAGVEAGHWYNSAALVPYGIFAGILLLAVALLANAIRQGGTPRSLSDIGALAWATSSPGARMLAAAVVMLAYIFCLVPRVDFILASALVLLALVYGFHEMRPRATIVALVAVLIPSFYALSIHYPQSEWNAPHDDDWLTLVAFVVLAIAVPIEVKASGGTIDRYIRTAPLIAFVVPFLLVIAMAFGFRQNVPNRTGLLFQTIEYQYYVTVKPWLAGSKRG